MNNFVFDMKVAGVIVRVSASLESTKDYCKAYIISPADNPDIVIDIDDEARDFILNDAKAEERDTNLKVVTTPDLIEVLALHKLLSDRMPMFGKALFHSSSITFDGEAVLFTAKSGTGKSTHANLWKKAYGDRVDYINDDKPFVGTNGVDDDGPIKVYGTPWNGKHHLGNNTSAPIKAICIIKRSENNYLEKMQPITALSTLLSQIYRPQEVDAFKNTMGIVKRLAEEIPIYTIHCNMDIEAAKIACEGIFATQN